MAVGQVKPTTSLKITWEEGREVNILVVTFTFQQATHLHGQNLQYTKEDKVRPSQPVSLVPFSQRDSVRDKQIRVSVSGGAL